MFDFMCIAKALTDENRVRILVALSERELCVCQITAFLDLAPSTTSKHLALLRQARLIESKKRGKWVYYSTTDSASAPSLVKEAIAWVRHGTADASTIHTDALRIKDILEQEEKIMAADPECAGAYHSLELHTLSDREEALLPSEYEVSDEHQR